MNRDEISKICQKKMHLNSISDLIINNQNHTKVNPRLQKYSFYNKLVHSYVEKISMYVENSSRPPKKIK